jgi:hypothetical protein
MTELIRRLLTTHLDKPSKSSTRRGIEAIEKNEILSFIGLGESGRSDGSVNHDRVIDDVMRGDGLR